MEYNYNNLPEEMRALNRWCLFRIEPKAGKPDAKPDKVPHQVCGGLAKSTDSKTLAPFSKVVPVPQGFDGINFAFMGEGLACVDLDHAIDEETRDIFPWAWNIVERIGSYCEMSYSGTGLHVVFKCKPLAKGRKFGNIEVYSTGKFISMTGWTFEGAPATLVEHDISWLIAEEDAKKATATKTATASAKSESEADFALMCKLIRAHGADHNKIKSEFVRQATERTPDRAAKINRPDYITATLSAAEIAVNKGKTSEPGNVVAPASAPPAPVIISDMSEAVFDGFLGKVCRERMSDFPIAYAWPALLGIASALVPRSSMRTPLYIDLDGGIGTGKSSAWERAFYLFGNPQEIIRLMAGSAEGLLERVGDIGGASRLVFVDEFAHLLEKSAIEHASFARVLTSIFYQDQLELTVAHRKRVSFNGRLTIVGGTVSEQFGDLFGSVSTGGLYDRFLFGRCPTGYQYLWRPNEVDGPPVFTPTVMTDDAMFPQNERPVPVTVDADVYRERDRWIKELKVGPRVAEVALRCAVICASWDGRTTLTAEMLGPALALAKYQMKAREVLKPNEGENTDAKCAHQIRTWLSANAGDGRWVSQRALDRGINARRHGPVVFKKCLDAMTFNGEIDREKHGRERVLRLCVDEETSASVIKKSDAVDDTSSPKSAEVSSRSLGRGCMYDQTIVNTEVINEVSSSAS